MGNHSSAFMTDRAHIYFICYSGENRLLVGSYISPGPEGLYKSDGILGRDPRPGVQKSGGVIYRYNTGEIRCLVRKQLDWAKSDPIAQPDSVGADCWRVQICGISFVGRMNWGVVCGSRHFEYLILFFASSYKRMFRIASNSRWVHSFCIWLLP